jgi:hypothetical protein
LRQLLAKIKRAIFHGLKLYPVYKVLDKINERFPLKNSVALEAFAYTGALQTTAYKHLPKYLEAWEIAADCKPELEKNLPGATVKITNSFEEVLRCKTKFNFINVDTMQGIFGDYCENFEFFPIMFNVMQDECIVNLNVIPHAAGKWRKKYSTVFNKEHLTRREKFYRTGDPENVTLDQMLKTYGEIAAEKGYSIIWHYYQKRTLTYYLVLHLKKTALK